jgi:hypothetical protein
MSGNNKYGSIEQVFITDAIYSVVMNTLATPPADMTIDCSLFNAKSFWSQTKAGASPRRGKLSIKEQPRITGYGLFCNFADGMVNVDDYTALVGLHMTVALNRYNAANANLGQASLSQNGNIVFATPELNMMYQTDILCPVDLVVSTDDHLRLDASSFVATGTFSTITIDPNFASKRIYFYACLQVEHSLAVLTSGF